MNENKKTNDTTEVELINPIEFGNDGKGAIYGKLIEAAIAEEKKKETPVESSKLISPVAFNEKTKDFEEKVYLVLLYTESDSADPVKEFEICTGRTNCYRYLQDVIIDAAENGYIIYLKRSLVITETMVKNADSGESKYYMLPITASMNVYDFCKKMESIYKADDFDIDAYLAEFDNEEDRDENIALPMIDGHINAAAILMREAMISEYGTADFTGNSDFNTKV